MLSRRWQLFAFLLAPAVASIASAQGSPIDKGSAIIAGSAAFSRAHDSDRNANSTSVHLQPTGLLFVQSRLAIGATVALGYLSLESGHTTSYGIGPAVRYYFGEPAGKLFPFLSASVFPQWQKSHLDALAIPGSTESDVSSRLLAFDGSFGLTRLVADHVGITGEAFYTHSKATADGGGLNASASGYDFGLRFGITAFVHR